MTYRTVKLDGVDAIQDDSEPTHFYPLHDGLAVFEKENVGIVPVEAYFQNSYHPIESNNIDWRNVRFKVKTKADNATTDYNIVSQLWGGLPDGSEQLVAEWIDPTISTTETTKEVLFDLNNSSTLPELSYQEPGSTSNYTCTLNLPLRWKNYDNIQLRLPWKEGYNYCKLVVLEGSNVPPKVGQNIVVPITVPYASGMKADFSDIRFVDSDGKTNLCHERVSYTSSTSAVFYVYVPNIPGYPERKSLMMFYGNSGAGTASNPFAIQFYDDFEDGKITGRSSPYENWTSPSSTLTATSSSPIQGTYSARLAGVNNSWNTYSYLQLNPYNANNYVVEFDVKLISQGSGSNSPMFALIARQDSNNYIRYYCYYDSSINRQVLRVQEYYAGSATTLTSVNYLTGKMPTGTIYSFRITNTGSSVKIEVNGTTYIDYAYNPRIIPSDIGFTTWYNEQVLFDRVRMRPYKAQMPTVTNFSGVLSNTAKNPVGTPSPETQELLMNIPSGFPTPMYAYVDELGVDGVRTNNVLIHNKGIYRLGADGVDKYVSLKLKNYVTADNNCNIEFSDFQYEYEVFE